MRRLPFLSSPFLAFGHDYIGILKRISVNKSEDFRAGQERQVDDMEDPTHRRIETPKPEAGLAEWTSKIKALQRDVDADGELEQKRLEEEIRASRLARSRRSGGVQFAGRVSLGGVTEHDEKGTCVCGIM